MGKDDRKQNTTLGGQEPKKDPTWRDRLMLYSFVGLLTFVGCVQCERIM